MAWIQEGGRGLCICLHAKVGGLEQKGFYLEKEHLKNSEFVSVSSATLPVLPMNCIWHLKLVATFLPLFPAPPSVETTL